MNSINNIQKFLISIGTFGGVTYYYLTNKQKEKVHTSWTTNFTPSTKWDENWDFRAPTSLVHPKKLKNEMGDVKEDMDNFSNLKPVATRHIILIRHGQYNLEGKTDSERILTGLGRTQAEWTAKRLRELGLPYTDIIKSTMSRAQETGHVISQHLPDVPVKECHMLREGAPIPPEPPVGHWKPGVHFFEDGARIEAAFRKYFHRADVDQAKDSYTVLVCHANVIRYFICRALQFPPEAWLRLSLNHASISWISITPSGRVILRALGDSGHMPANVITSH
ncbi:serine/threonine-protein phosphatase Pgam5, mitochondrial isoform X2 [Onthophagus taurus]|uniref:serine/threonine-protein phosphatase Pgam5, mitochondrial isoform X2 n=1 Tax=Onthophagus taurus TaxID=166361 RepID=UPI000C20CB39|nr:serine/threonine-protein phosphatase Pgam5, mitochondrial isoform X2 [Onthophagus taurus]